MAWNGFHFNLHLGFGLSQSTIMEIKFGFLTPQFMDIIFPCLNIFSMIKIIIGLRKINKGNDG